MSATASSVTALPFGNVEHPREVREWRPLSPSCSISTSDAASTTFTKKADPAEIMKAATAAADAFLQEAEGSPRPRALTQPPNSIEPSVPLNQSFVTRRARAATLIVPLAH